MLPTFIGNLSSRNPPKIVASQSHVNLSTKQRKCADTQSMTTTTDCNNVAALKRALLKQLNIPGKEMYRDYSKPDQLDRNTFSKKRLSQGRTKSIKDIDHRQKRNVIK